MIDKRFISYTHRIGKEPNIIEVHQLSLFPVPRFYHATFAEDAVHWFSRTRIKLYADGLMSAVAGRTQLDLPKIDKTLISNYGEYQKDGCCIKCSLYDRVLELFGEDYAFLLDKWTIIPTEISENNGTE